MDITTLGVASVAAITVICYGLGVLIKASPLDSKYIPPIMALAGAVLGVAGMVLMPDYPASDYLTAVAVGIVSGLAATGINQAVKQLTGDKEG